MESIKEKVIEAIKMVNKRNIDFSQMTDENLMGTKINMSPIELVYFFEKIENDYNIKFNVEDFDNKDFYCINTIAKKIYSCINV